MTEPREKADRWEKEDQPHTGQQGHNDEPAGRWGYWMYPSSSPEVEGELDSGTHGKERGTSEGEDS